MNRLTNEEVKGLLRYIDPSSLDYQQWLNVGMALKHEGYSADMFESWSRGDPRHKEGECFEKWESFHEEAGSVITIGTVIDMAKSNGWKKPRKKGKALDWNSKIRISAPQDDSESDSTIAEPNTWDSKGELIRYLQTLFDDDDHVSYVVKSGPTMRNDGTVKYTPKNAGNSDRTAKELIDALMSSDTIEKVLGDYDHEAGAWIRFNPMDGKGAGNKNVTSYRFALVESDTMSIDEQIKLIRKLELPVAALVHSGGKSVHAIVKVDASNAGEYASRVKKLYKVCEDNGMVIDTQNKNPARLSRMPGCERGSRKQYIIDTDIGQPDWKSWEEWLEEEADDLPPFESLAETWENPPVKPPQLIHGVLRQSHKMLLSGPSKAGKTFALLELAVAIAEGSTWLGHKCEQGKVLYINLEVDRASCIDRLHKIYEAAQLEPKNIKNVIQWHIRGKGLTMKTLVPKLIRKAKKENFIAIILDPIYKVSSGDENSAADIIEFCNKIDIVCNELGVSMIYCHHHSKGNQSGKKAMDRASGSGVFARDPDAVVDLLEYAVPDDMPEDMEVLMKRCFEIMKDEEDEETEPNPTAWKIEYTLREFNTPKPKYGYFFCPIHVIDKDGVIEKGNPADDPQQKGAEATKEKGNKNLRDFEKWMSLYGKDLLPIGMITERYNEKNESSFQKETVRGWINKLEAEKKVVREGDGATTKYQYKVLPKG